MTADAGTLVDFLYGQRPSKHVQRRMVVDACRRLDRFARLTQYRYVGFGSYEFVDFDLVHRELGIVDMDSIEIEPSIVERCEFNKPFKRVEVHAGRASEILPDLLDAPVQRIVWLDYVCWLDPEVIADVATCLRKLEPGSVLLTTFKAKPSIPADERRDALSERLTEERILPGIGNADLGAGGLADVQRDILVQSIAEPLSQRQDGGGFLQLFDLRYKDSTPMQTWGGIVTSPLLDDTRVRDSFGDLEQVSLPGARSVSATVPPLTTREVLHLNSQLPNEGTLQANSIPAAQLDAYRRLYRWYPPVPAAM